MEPMRYNGIIMASLYNAGPEEAVLCMDGREFKLFKEHCNYNKYTPGHYFIITLRVQLGELVMKSISGILLADLSHIKESSEWKHREMKDCNAISIDQDSKDWRPWNVRITSPVK